MVQECELRNAESRPALTSANTNLVTILQWRASHQPQRLAFRFLSDESEISQNQGLSWSYAELYQRTSAIAAQLSQFAHQPVVLAFPAGLDFVAAFLGCLQAGAIAVPVPLPGRHQRLERWQQVVLDACPQAIVTTAQQLPNVRSRVQVMAGELPHSVACMVLPATSERTHPPKVERTISPDDIALLQYTSGSTRQPRGVMISHGNLMHNLAITHTQFGHSQDSQGVIWLPPHHDMGLIGGILQPLYGGFPVTLMTPASFLRQPIRWLQAISVFGGTTSGGPNFAYERCLQKITPEHRIDLDLTSWDLAFTGAEPIRAETLRQFSETFAEFGFRPSAFYPCYGLAEATLFVSGSSKASEPTTCSVDRAALIQGQVVDSQTEGAVPLVSCGQGAADQSTLIVDPQTGQRCGGEQVGEIWLTGPSVAQGYWQQIEATQEIFRAKLADDTGPYLRTGDLGFLRHGELFVTGRLKDLILIRGQNHYPQDIEQTVAQSHAAVQAQWGAAFGVEMNGEERLVVTQEVKRTALRSLDADAVVSAIRAAISRQHGLQVHGVLLLKPGSLPKTTSGKVRRHACKAGFEDNSLEAIKQWTLDQGDQASTAGIQAQPAVPLSQPNHGDLDRATALIQWLRQYASDSINSRLMDERRCISPGVVLDFGNQGLLGMQVPTEYAGLGLGHYDMLRVLEQLGAIDPTLALFVGLNNVLGIRPILQSASPNFKADWLPQLATGRELAAFALTEPGAGSNPNAIQSKVVVDTDSRWRLYGEKIWSGSAAWAGIINVFVQHSDLSGISGFAIRKGTPGLRQGPEALTMGMRGMVQNTVYLDGVSVSAEQLLGQPGGGMAVAQDAMRYGRLAIASACIGGMKRCAQLMLRYSSRRVVSTGRLLENPVLLSRLGRLTAQISALSALVNWIAQRLDDRNIVLSAAFTACKILAPEFYWQAADDLVQCLGGRGYIETNLAPQILRDARVLRIFEGPTETLTMHLGAQVLASHSDLKPFLSQELAVPELAERLFAGAEDILARYYHRHDDTVVARRWAYLAVGELVAIALLLAIQKSSVTTDARALTWTQLYFEQKLAQALASPPDEVVTAAADQTADWVASYAHTIGDIESSLTGEDHELDALLKQNPSSRLAIADNIADDPKSDVVKEQLPSKQPTTKSLEQWLLQWLGQRLQLSKAEMDINKAFADYGVDSVMAVELAHDLEEFLQLKHPLDATLAWNFPTISALAAHLTVSANVHPSPRVEAAKGTTTEQVSLGSAKASSKLQTLEDLNEAEMADVLAAELAALQGKRP